RGAENGDDLAVGDVERHIVEHGPFGESDGHIDDVKHRWSRGARGCPRSSRPPWTARAGSSPSQTLVLAEVRQPCRAGGRSRWAVSRCPIGSIWSWRRTRRGRSPPRTRRLPTV